MVSIKDADEESSQKLLDTVLLQSETQKLETKRVSGKMVGKALETVCAFANTKGGLLLLGIEDALKARGNDRLFGIGENREAVDEFLRKLDSQFLPPIEGINAYRLRSALRDGSLGEIIAVSVPRSAKVHSIRDNGTWARGQASNRAMTAAEIIELSYQRGIKSAESELVAVSLDLLETDTWKLFVRSRGLTGSDIANQLFRLGLADKLDGQLLPRRAAVLLFADHPGSLLASGGVRADVRVFHYRGTSIEHSEVPNLKKTPKTLYGPLYRLLEQTCAYVLDELAHGLTLASSGFRTKHRYPERVIKEAITNALIHRDYHLNRDVQINIFDNRLEVISPGLLPGRITAARIDQAGSFARNPLLASNLREFPSPPNVDAGEGVRMMFQVMREHSLYPPQYLERRDQAQQAVMVTLLNEERPPIWEQVSDWMEQHGPIGNSQLCRIAKLDTLKASKQLRRWVEQGLLVADPTRAKRNALYFKPATAVDMGQDLLISAPDNNLQ